MSENILLCPRCDSPMVLKTAHKGRNAGGKFYSCTRFPRCRGTRTISTASMGAVQGLDRDNKGIEALDEETKEKLISLIRYYRECIQVESLNDVEFYADNENETFVQCVTDIEWLSSGKEKLEIKLNTDLREFGRRYRYKSRPLSYYYAYPVYIHKFFRRDNGEQSTTVIPFLIFPIIVEKNSERIILKRIEDVRPQINTRVLEKRGIASRPEQKRDFIQRIIEKWDPSVDYSINLKVINQYIIEEFSSSEILLDEKLNSLSFSSIDIQSSKSGFYSTGILFVTQGSDYTIGLEEELGEIETVVSKNKCTLPVLKSIIKRETTKTDNKSHNNNQLVEITPLNDEQREAIRSTFSNDLSIITGPPGTGKSQVVINIIANAVAKGQTVLFGSKNHQAVDVVLERISQIQEQPIILKFGQSSKESIFVEKLLNAVDKSISINVDSLKSDKDALSSEITKLAGRETEVWNKISEIYEERNQIDKIDNLISSIEERLPEELIQYCNNAALEKFTKLNTSILSKYIKELESGKHVLLTEILAIFGFTLFKRIRKRLLYFIQSEHFDKQLKDYFEKDLDNPEQILAISKNFVDTAVLLGQLKICNELRQKKTAIAGNIIELENKLSELQEKRYALSPKYIDILMIEKFKSLGRQIRKDIADYEATLKRIEEDVVGGDVARELRRQKKGLFESVVKAFPAIAVSNLSVRHAAPLSPASIDLVVIDEASQCDIASALPMLFRAKRAVIIGDEKQLIHVSNIHRPDDQQIQNKHKLVNAEDQRFLYSSQSLFDLCKTTVGTSGEYFILRDHYRSRAEIIEFSNKEFYGGLLRVWTDYRKLKQTGEVEGIYWHDVKGKVIRPTAGSAFNLEEANMVFEILKSILPKAISLNASVGIVTPFREQENKIRDLIKGFSHSDIDAVDLHIDTAHGFQGDERDIIIFSPVVSQGLHDRTKGFLLSTQNLFNVAITRPRAELHIVGDRSYCSKCGIEYLERFTSYASRVNRINLYERDRYKELFDSPWEKLFYDKLLEKGIHCTPQLAIHQYKLDLAIDNNDPPLDIEIDGEFYHRTITGERSIEDIKRDIRLNLLGWIVKRFWVYEIKYDLERCLNEIDRLVKV